MNTSHKYWLNKLQLKANFLQSIIYYYPNNVCMLVLSVNFVSFKYHNGIFLHFNKISFVKHTVNLLAINIKQRIYSFFYWFGINSYKQLFRFKPYYQRPQKYLQFASYRIFNVYKSETGNFRFSRFRLRFWF